MSTALRTVAVAAEDRTVTLNAEIEGGSAMTFAWPDKDPDEKLDYTMDWTARLDEGDTIISSSWAWKPRTPGGIGLTNYTIPQGSKTTRVWIDGGVLGATYFITNHITTAGGRVMEQTVSLRIASK